MQGAFSFEDRAKLAARCKASQPVWLTKGVESSKEMQ